MAEGRSKYNPLIHHRRSIRLRGYDYSQAGMYFVTICTQDRLAILGSCNDTGLHLSPLGTISEQCWLELPVHFPSISLDEYVIMPDHLHGIIVLQNSEIDDDIRRGEVPSPRNTEGDETSPRRKRVVLGSVVGYYKYMSTKLTNELRGSPGERLWQRNYYEHIVRDENDLRRIRRYIASNPMRWGSGIEDIVMNLYP